MTKTALRLATVIALAGVAVCGQEYDAGALSQKQSDAGGGWIADAIRFGESFKSVDDLWARTKDNYAVHSGHLFWGKGFARKITIITPFMAVAATAAIRKTQLSHLSFEEARALPLDTILVLDVSGVGATGQWAINKLYNNPGSTIVLSFGDGLVHPVASSGATGGLPSGLTTWQTNRIGALSITNQTGDFRGAGLRREFTYQLTEKQRRMPVTVILIDSQAHQYRSAIDLAKYR